MLVWAGAVFTSLHITSARAIALTAERCMATLPDDNTIRLPGQSVQVVPHERVPLRLETDRRRPPVRLVDPRVPFIVHSQAERVAPADELARARRLGDGELVVQRHA